MPAKTKTAKAGTDNTRVFVPYCRGLASCGLLRCIGSWFGTDVSGYNFIPIFKG